ncbi:MAG: ABC transporter ATP-binding protein [Planctomycetes bacterium]|jgi:putative ABC transport system ATP-binding protein|nr:ABC transporter ATP-binding protein [Planctomycetota bacterium]MBT6451850.1 ABC transporter ATP-binding protein [Planctomycetota bacterium]MBT6541453.1 ABC transporter ATP-binding protein [Planctomycetota bacterium]MBT6783607.1 ABC transporter ATP-binding protein [Planctomycetota bacterium]MBT6969343.1 ABC transporter ATP-binding protein [Planctomycetota bacterium]
MFVQMEQIRKCYGEGDGMIAALDGVDLTVEKGEFIAIVGSSGSGKSTLLQILGCLDHADSGTYQLGGRDVQSLTGAEMARIRNETIGFVFQSFHLLGDRDALENVSLPLEYRRSAAPEVSPTQVLERVGLADRITHRPSQLSGGERQRVAIARALVKEPGLLLCDEPTGNLDSASGDQVLSLLSDLRDELNTTLVLVTHDVEVAARADRVLSMKDGRWS